MSDTRAAVYIRLSDPRQADGYSLETQLAGCRAYAGKLGLTVVSEFRETHTAVELFERPELTKLRAAMARNEFDHLIVYVLDRLSREPMHTGLIFSEASYYGVQVHSALEKIEDTDEGRLLVNITGYVAKKEHAKIAERTQRGRRARAASGKYMNGGRPRYGYRWGNPAPHAKDSLEPDPATGPVVQRIFRLTEEGIPTPFAGLVRKRAPDRAPLEHYPFPGVWDGTTIGNIVRDATYTGQAIAYRTQRIRRNGRKVDVPRALEDQVVLPDGVVAPLVSAEVFQALQGRLRRNQEQATRNNQSPEDALLRAGFAFCGVCRSDLIVHHRTNGTRTPIYQCDNVRRHDGAGSG
ncbi:MAG: recombinase family protein [Chloroflexi bacterium]|nr:recombinase family protein [Chloroflexota bacterium]